MFKFFKEKDFYYPFIIWIGIVFWYLIFASMLFTTQQHKFQDRFSSDAFYFFNRTTEEAKDVVIVAIDESSRSNMHLKWPWKRSAIGQLVRGIAAGKPKVIGLDIVFSGKSEQAEDAALVSDLASHPNVVIGYVLKENAAELPYPDFVKAVKDIGFVNKPLGTGNIVKDIRNFYIDKDGKLHYSIDIKLVANFLGVEPKDFKITQDGTFLGDELFVPSKKGITPLNYLVYHNQFTIIPAFMIFENKIDPKIFKDKIVLLATTDPLLHDEYATPLGIFPGGTIIANSVVMMLSGKYIHQVPMWQNLVVIFILGLLILIINKKLLLRFSTLCTFALFVAIFFGFLFLRAKDIQFDYFGVFLLCFCSFVTSNIYKHSYFIYMRHKLKNLAIAEPITGLYTVRFFLLKFNEELHSKLKSCSFSTITISDYKRLILDLDFKESNQFLKSLTEYIKTSVKRVFSNVIFTRISPETIGVALPVKDKAKAEDFFKKLLIKLNEIEFKVNDSAVQFHTKGIFLYKAKAQKAQAEEILCNMKELIEDLKKEPKTDFMSANFEEGKYEKEIKPLKEDILDFIASDLEERNKDLEGTLKALSESKKETEEAYFAVIRSLVKALEEKDTFTEGHSERVADYSKKIAERAGLPRDEIDLIYKASLLHDIGKIGLPDYLLHKKEQLEDHEMKTIRKHATTSTNILKPIKVFKDLLPIVLHHHENVDGTGYPHGLSADLIPIGAQILAVADSFDAITCGRGYKKGISVKKAIDELDKGKGKRFNPVYVDILKDILKNS